MRLLASACLLTAFAGCNSASVEPQRPHLPPSLTQPCAAPVALPDRGLTDQEVERLWGRDRSALRACASRHAALAGAM
jgi:hypothetical protein